MSFENILKKLEKQVENTTAYILVDDLNHLVKGGPLSNGSAILGNILSIKPILHFNGTYREESYETLGCPSRRQS